MRGEHWERGPVTLKFQLGDIVLGRATLSLFRRSARLNELPLDISDLTRPNRRRDSMVPMVM